MVIEGVRVGEGVGEGWGWFGLTYTGDPVPDGGGCLSNCVDNGLSNLLDG